MSELPLFIFLGLTGMLGNQLLYIMGIYSSTPNIASVFQVKRIEDTYMLPVYFPHILLIYSFNLIYLPRCMLFQFIHACIALQYCAIR